MSHFAAVNEIYESFFEKGKYPARVCYAVAALPKGSLIEIDMIAVTDNSGEEKIQGASPEKKVKKD